MVSSSVLDKFTNAATSSVFAIPLLLCILHYVSTFDIPRGLQPEITASASHPRAKTPHQGVQVKLRSTITNINLLINPWQVTQSSCCD